MALRNWAEGRRGFARHCLWPWLGCALIVAGCAQLPRIDPNGDRLFIWPGEPAQGPVPPPGAVGTSLPPPGALGTTLAPPGVPPATSMPTRPGAPLQLPNPPAGPTPVQAAARPVSNLTFRATGPSQASVGAAFTYHLEVTNTSDNAVRDVVVKEQDPQGIEFVSSEPEATPSGASQQWSLGELAPRATATVDVNYRVNQAGELRYCVEVRSASGVAARQCVTTRIVAAALDVSVLGPTDGQVGGEASFEIQVINRGTSTLKGVLVTDRFGSGLRHAAASSPIERDLVDLPPGGTGRLGVTFQVVEAGQLCQDIVVTADGGMRTTARHCLTAVEAPATAEAPAATPPPAGDQPPASDAKVSIKQTVPPRQRIGDMVRFRVDVTNNTDAPLANVEIGDNFETSLEPRQATEGSTWLKGDVLGWKIPSLEPGKSLHREIEFKCLRETPRACNRVTVAADGIDPVADEACLEIVGQNAAVPPVASSAGAAGVAAGAAAPDPLSVTVADTADPIKVDGETTYQIVLTNESQQSLFDVAVTATFSEEVKLSGLSGPVHGAVLPSTVRFDPIREVRAGESPLSFELRVKALRPGTARMRVDVMSRGQAKPVSAEQSTEILQPK